MSNLRGRRCPSPRGLVTQCTGPEQAGRASRSLWDSLLWVPTHGTLDLGDLRAQSGPCVSHWPQATQPCVPEAWSKQGFSPSHFILGSLQVYCHMQQLHPRKSTGPGAS